MSDVVVTVPKNFTHPAAPGKRGLEAWLSEGDPAGSEWSGTRWEFTTYGGIPQISAGERVYVVCEGKLVGYAPLLGLMIQGEQTPNYHGPLKFIRGGGAVAC